MAVPIGASGSDETSPSGPTILHARFGYRPLAINSGSASADSRTVPRSSVLDTDQPLSVAGRAVQRTICVHSLLKLDQLTQSGPQLVAARYSYLACLGWAVLLGALVVWLARRAYAKALIS